MAQHNPEADQTPPGSVRILLACRTREEFFQEFVPRCRRNGVFVATRYPPPIGSRFRLQMVLIDGAVVFSGDAVVTARDQEGSCPGIRALPEISDEALPEGVSLAEYLFTECPSSESPAGETHWLAAPAESVRPLDLARPPPHLPTAKLIDQTRSERTFRPPLGSITLPPPEEPVAGWRSLLADRLETMATAALRDGKLDAAVAHCQLAVRADPARMGPRALLQRMSAIGRPPDPPIGERG